MNNNNILSVLGSYIYKNFGYFPEDKDLVDVGSIIKYNKISEDIMYGLINKVHQDYGNQKAFHYLPLILKQNSKIEIPPEEKDHNKKLRIMEKIIRNRTGATSGDYYTLCKVCK